MMPHKLKAVFENHERRGPDERDQSCDLENLFRAIVAWVQNNQMVYMGVCGGAMCAGRSLLHPSAHVLGLFDFCMGVSIKYDSDTDPVKFNTDVIDRSTFLITRGAGLAVHIEDDIALLRAFQLAKTTNGGRGAKGRVPHTKQWWVQWLGRVQVRGGVTN